MHKVIPLFTNENLNDTDFFELEYIDALSQGDRFKEEVHRHNFYEIFIFFSGKGKHTIDFKEYTIQKGMIHIVAPYQVHSVKRNDKTTGIVLKFSEDSILYEDVLKLMQNYALFGASPEIEAEDYMDKLKGFISIFEALEQDNLVYQKATFIHLLGSFLYFISSLSTQSKEPYSGIEIEFVKLVNQHYKKEYSVAFYAGEMNSSSKKINLAINKRFGITAKQFISRRRLLEAKRLLHHSSMLIKEVAYELGFQSPSHFSAFFYKETNMYPSDF